MITRKLVTYKHQEHDYNINPWSTHNHFIISHTLLHKPEYHNTLLTHLDERIHRNLFVLDETHAATPTSTNK
jgi:hypothetical protein